MLIWTWLGEFNKLCLCIVYGASSKGECTCEEHGMWFECLIFFMFELLACACVSFVYIPLFLSQLQPLPWHYTFLKVEFFPLHDNSFLQLVSVALSVELSVHMKIGKCSWNLTSCIPLDIISKYPISFLLWGRVLAKNIVYMISWRS